MFWSSPLLSSVTWCYPGSFPASPVFSYSPLGCYSKLDLTLFSQQFLSMMPKSNSIHQHVWVMNPKSVFLISPEPQACSPIGPHFKFIKYQMWHITGIHFINQLFFLLHVSVICPLCLCMETSFPGHLGSKSRSHLWLLLPLKFHIQTVTKAWPALGCNLPLPSFIAAVNRLLPSPEQGGGDGSDRDLTWRMIQKERLTGFGEPK